MKALSALDRKLLRDLRAMWSQALTIALVVASGVGGFLTTLSAVDSLAVARDRFYVEARFADIFASVKRAPDSMADVLRATPGVAEVDTRSQFYVRIQVADSSDPITGLLIGIQRQRPSTLNRLVLRRGLPDDPASLSPGGPLSDGAWPAWISESFANVRGLRPGSRLTALVNGKQRTLVVAGVALSPEYIFAGLFGMPDQRGFGVFWVDSVALGAAYDMEGAFNQVSVKLAPGADERAVSAELQRLLTPFGTREVQGRETQTSHAMVENEIKEQHVMGTVLPAIFLGVAAFLLNVVISRLVATQREQIAALKALGYANRAIAAHYLKLVLAIVALGFLLGLVMGRWLGTALLALYADFFRLPVFEHRFAPVLLLVAFALTLATAVGGTLNALLATMRLAPAEAMRPPAPGRYRRTLLERAGIRRISTSLRMILRQMERRPWRTALSVAGVAASVAIVVMGNFFRDAMDHIVHSQFAVVMRSDVSFWLADPAADDVRHQVARLPGVTMTESTRYASVRLQNGAASERTVIRGLPAAPELMRVVDMDNRAHDLPDNGIVLTDRLAAKLHLRVGDTVLAEVLEGRERTLALVVRATVSEMMGLNAYMRREALNRALGEGDLSSAFWLRVERGRESELLDATRTLPRVAGAFSKGTLLRNMQEVSARNIRVMSTVLTLFAAVIAVGVVYNNARIALAERSWELASLRVLGFTRAEVSTLMLGELAIVIAVALPLGMALGLALVHAVVGLLANDQFHFPVVILPRTYATAAIAVLVAGVGSALVVRRRIDRLDMVAALKTRE